jgi:hypothetical protein
MNEIKKIQRKLSDYTDGQLKAWVEINKILNELENEANKILGKKETKNDTDKTN